MRVDLTKAITLETKKIVVGQQAPDFCLAKLDGRIIDDVCLKDFGNSIKVISCFPSIDTGVCDLQTKKLYEEYGNVEGLALLNVSADLVFAFNKWCGANNMKNIFMLSDYRDHKFAKDYGVNILHANIIYRSVFIIDQQNIVRYVQLAKGISEPLDFYSIKQAINNLLNKDI
ncbi:MAG: thiol peroxidase [Malacoplasma sp.]|nr:thiol peroxidase [Malacoplasma sp.]MDE7075526.1 thiol peroxidase [Malacoplasma sp.]